MPLNGMMGGFWLVRFSDCCMEVSVIMLSVVSVWEARCRFLAGYECVLRRIFCESWWFRHGCGGSHKLVFQIPSH